MPRSDSTPNVEELQAQIAALQAQLAAAQGSVSVVGGQAGLAQSGGVAAGAGGVAVGGDVFGNIYQGTSPANDAEAAAIYRRVYASACRNLPLRGIDIGASDPAGKEKRLGLDHVYVDLNTETQVGKKSLAAAMKTGEASRLWIPRQQAASTMAEVGMRQAGEKEEENVPLSALLAARFTPRMVLLGDPGSGKSTFLNHLGLCLAMHGLEPKGGWLERLRGWPAAEGDLLPIAVTLRDFARALPAGRGKASPQQLWDFIAARLHDQNMSFAADPLRVALEKGRALVLLDGLDEIPTKAARKEVRDAVAAFAVRYAQARMVVTCRTLSYQDPAWQLEATPFFELAPFTAKQIDRFIAAWYGELQALQTIKAEQVAGLTQRLQAAVRRSDLRHLAANPLLLTVMALVHTHKGRLPDARALLYEDTVDILLWRWDEMRFGDEDKTPRLRSLLQQAGRGEADLKRVLWALAFAAHQSVTSDDQSLADISEWQLEKALAGLHPQGSRDWAMAVIDIMKLRAGLLLERAPEVYTFPHRTFQEYLAGCHLAVQGEFAKQAASLVQDGSFWRQVILLAVGRLTELGDTAKPLTLVAELCPAVFLPGDLGWRKAWLAGEALTEMGLNRVRDSALGQDLLARVRERLADLLLAAALAPVERAAAGEVLANLGDPRPGVGLRPDRLPDIDWILVPELDPQSGEGKWTYQRGRRKPEPDFWIARYPITYAQFQAFLDAPDGFRQSGWWQGLAVDKSHRSSPGEQRFQHWNHPRERVSWYDAIAFCRWLTAQAKRNPDLLPVALQGTGNWQITLPREWQWEKAARGFDGREYPWGQGYQSGRANVDETNSNVGPYNLQQTSAVGMYPHAVPVDSSFGCADLSGNVWEWCLNQYEQPDRVQTEGEADRIVRGGSWYNLSDLAAAAVRRWRVPDLRYGYIGFRVVVRLASL